MKWYKLPLAEQRVYQFLLVHAQEPRVIRLAHVYPLNMELFLNVSDIPFICTGCPFMQNDYIFIVFQRILILTDHQNDLLVWHGACSHYLKDHQWSSTNFFILSKHISIFHHGISKHIKSKFGIIYI